MSLRCDRSQRRQVNYGGREAPRLIITSLPSYLFLSHPPFVLRTSLSPRPAPTYRYDRNMYNYVAATTTPPPHNQPLPSLINKYSPGSFATAAASAPPHRHQRRMSLMPPAHAAAGANEASPSLLFRSAPFPSPLPLPPRLPLTATMPARSSAYSASVASCLYFAVSISTHRRRSASCPCCCCSYSPHSPQCKYSPHFPA